MQAAILDRGNIAGIYMEKKMETRFENQAKRRCVWTRLAATSRIYLEERGNKAIWQTRAQSSLPPQWPGLHLGFRV